MIDHIVELYRAVPAEVPDATLDELRAVITANPNADVNSLALAIWAARPCDDEDAMGDDLVAWRRSRRQEG